MLTQADMEFSMPPALFTATDLSGAQLKLQEGTTDTGRRLSAEGWRVLKSAAADAPSRCHFLCQRVPQPVGKVSPPGGAEVPMSARPDESGALPDASCLPLDSGRVGTEASRLFSFYRMVRSFEPVDAEARQIVASVPQDRG